MDKLLSLHPVRTQEQDTQANHIWNLMQAAAAKKETYVIYDTAYLHPLIFHVLTSKGYKVEEINTGTYVLSPTKKYKIYI